MTRGEIEKEIGVSLEVVASIGPRGLWPRELVSLYATSYTIKPKVVVEVGSFHGVSSVTLGFVVKKCKGMLYSFDCTPQPRWVQNMERFGVSEFAKFTKVTSPNVEVATLPFKVIDYLLIDGDHHYEAALADYNFWEKLVRPGGRIAVHDYSSHKGVRQAVTELLAADSKLKQLEVVDGQMYNEAAGDTPEPGLIVLEKCA